MTDRIYPKTPGVKASGEFGAIKQRHAERIERKSRATRTRIHEDIGLLIEMVEALQHLAHPRDETRGSCPLVLYFKNEEDRQGMIDAALEAMPGARAVKVP